MSHKEINEYMATHCKQIAKLVFKQIVGPDKYLPCPLLP